MADTLQSWVDRIRAGEVRALARAISTIEDNRPESRDLLKALFNFTGRAQIIGLTGAPGAGKSTLVDQLAREYRKQERTVGIIAVDPTSPYTGGAILGDRIRMQAHHADPGIYIRSMATRGNLGGLARSTTDAATVLDAAGKDMVLIETVGVGQDEIDIVRLADVTVVILVPGMGDDVQTIKAGIMEIADIFVINKSDREGADRVEREIRSMQSLAIRADKWTPPIIKTVASEGKGISELAATIASYEQYLQQKELLLKKKISSWRERLIEMLRDRLLERLLSEHVPEEKIAGLAADIAEHKKDPYSLVEEIVGSFAERNDSVLISKKETELHPKQQPTEQVDQIIRHIESTLDLSTASGTFSFWASLPLCIIDSVFSIQAKYPGVLKVVKRWCESLNWEQETPSKPSNNATPTVSDFVKTIEQKLGQGATYESLFGNLQRTSSKGGILKAEAVHRFAKALLESGIDTFIDLQDEQKLQAAKELITKIPGQKSGITFKYFLMLAGKDDFVKPDTHIRRFVSDALGIDWNHLNLTPEGQAEDLLKKAVKALVADFPTLTLTKLDFAIWSYQHLLTKPSPSPHV